MESKRCHRPWNELMPDTLGLIFKRLPLDEILNVVPSVCKSWARAVRGPYCWQEIDIEEWSRYRRPESLDQMLILLIGRSRGSLRKLSVYGLATDLGLSVIVDNAKNLRYLRLPGSEISNPMVEQVAGKLASLTSLDLSYCTKIGPPALETIGKHCKLLTDLKRNMHPWDVPIPKSQDNEAFAIADTMPQLRHLELAYLIVTTKGVLKILTKCRELELLDMKGCWNVQLDEDILKNRSMLKVIGPLVVDGGCKKKTYVNLEYYPASSNCWALGWNDMDHGNDDNEDDDDDDGGGSRDDNDDDDDNISLDDWNTVHFAEDLDLWSYDDPLAFDSY